MSTSRSAEHEPRASGHRIVTLEGPENYGAWLQGIHIEARALGIRKWIHRDVYDREDRTILPKPIITPVRPNARDQKYSKRGSSGGLEFHNRLFFDDLMQYNALMRGFRWQQDKYEDQQEQFRNVWSLITSTVKPSLAQNLADLNIEEPLRMMQIIGSYCNIARARMLALEKFMCVQYSWDDGVVRAVNEVRGHAGEIEILGGVVNEELLLTRIFLLMPKEFESHITMMRSLFETQAQGWNYNLSGLLLALYNVEIERKQNRTSPEAKETDDGSDSDDTSLTSSDDDDLGPEGASSDCEDFTPTSE